MRRVTHFIIPEVKLKREWRSLYFFTRPVDSREKFFRLYTDEEVYAFEISSWVYRGSVGAVLVEPKIRPEESLWLTDNFEVVIASATDPQNDPNRRRIYV